MEINCPKCNHLNLDVDDVLPDRVCDDLDFYCDDCDHKFVIGWTAEVEIRDDKLEKVN